MKQKIIGYHLDSESHWVADLECGHAQHVRHDPPWTLREWVTTDEGRASQLGAELNCVRCDQAAHALANEILAEVKLHVFTAYENAGMSGLCQEGRLEVALDSLNTIDIESVAERALRPRPKP